MALISGDGRSQAMMAPKIKRLIGAALLAVSLSSIVAGSLTFPATDANAWTGAPPQGAVFLQLMYGKNYDVNNAHSALQFMEWQYEASNKVDFETAADGGPLSEATRYLLSGLRCPDFSNVILNELTDDIKSSQSDINKLKFWTRVASILYWGGTPFNSPEIRSHATDVIYNIMQASANDRQKLEVLADLSKILFSGGGVEKAFSPNGPTYYVPKYATATPTFAEAHSALQSMERLYEVSNKVEFEVAARGGPNSEASRYLLSGLREPNFSNFVLNEITNYIKSSQSDINKLKFWTRVASILYWGGTPFNSREIRSHASDVIYNTMQANSNDRQKLEVLADLSRILFFKGGVERAFSSNGPNYYVPKSAVASPAFKPASP
jgi:hypothetical protein